MLTHLVVAAQAAAELAVAALSAAGEQRALHGALGLLHDRAADLVLGAQLGAALVLLLGPGLLVHLHRGGGHCD